MANEWRDLSDDKLAHIAQEGLQGQGSPVGAMRRLRVTIEQSGAESDTYSRRMLYLNIIVTALTLAQAIAVVPVIRAWFN